MGWFRRHIGIGSGLALLALTLQFVLAFGHVHPAHAQAAKSTAPSYIELVAAAIDAETGFVPAYQPAPDDHDRRDHRPLTDTCAVCAVVAMAATTLFSSSPILHLPEAITLLSRATEVGFAHLDPSHAPFQPRGPPVS